MAELVDFRLDLPNERAIAARFDRLPAEVRGALAPAIRRIVEAWRARVIAREPHRTGKLQQETQAFVNDSGDRIRGVVKILTQDGAEHGKAAALEYGAHGVVKVQGYSRRDAAIAAYQRHANIAERRFLRDAPDREAAIAELRAAIGAQ